MRVRAAAGRRLARRHALCSRGWQSHSPQRSRTMNQARVSASHPDLSADLVELVALVETLPSEVRQRVGPALGRVVDSTARRRRILNLVQDALSQLRLDMKYLMFDLEATRRERDEYHARLQEFES